MHVNSYYMITTINHYHLPLSLEFFISIFTNMFLWRAQTFYLWSWLIFINLFRCSLGFQALWVLQNREVWPSRTFLRLQNRSMSHEVKMNSVWNRIPLGYNNCQAFSDCHPLQEITAGTRTQNRPETKVSKIRLSSIHPIPFHWKYIH